MAIQDLVNQIESALPSIITKGLDTLIVTEGMDLGMMFTHVKNLHIQVGWDVILITLQQ